MAMSAGQAMDGGWLSVTVTLKLQLVALPEASVAVQVTVVSPLSKQVPEDGTQTVATPGQLSLAVGAKMAVPQH